MDRDRMAKRERVRDRRGREIIIGRKSRVKEERKHRGKE